MAKKSNPLSGFGFRKSVKLFPGVRLNSSKSGISVSIGGRGGHVTYGRGRTTYSAGIPGTGIYYRKTVTNKTRKNSHSYHTYASSDSKPIQPMAMFWLCLIMMVAVIVGLSYSIWLGLLGGVLAVFVSSIVHSEETRKESLRQHADVQSSHEAESSMGSNSAMPTNPSLATVNISQSDLILKQAEFNRDFQSRLKIFNEANRLIQITNDYPLFEEKMRICKEFMEWSHDMIDSGVKGAHLNMTREESTNEFNKVYNENAYRIATFIASTGDTPRKALNRIPKIEEILSKVKDGPNKMSTTYKLRNVLSKLKEKASQK